MKYLLYILFLGKCQSCRKRFRYSHVSIMYLPKNKTKLWCNLCVYDNFPETLKSWENRMGEILDEIMCPDHSIIEGSNKVEEIKPEDIRHCSQCKKLKYRPQSYCKPYCSLTGEDIFIDVWEQKPNWCRIEAKGEKLGES